MNIAIEKQNFLPHCSCSVDLYLMKGHINLITGENGVGKSTLAKLIKETFFNEVTLIAQSPLNHFYDRTLDELKNIFMQSTPVHFDATILNSLWQELALKDISSHSVKKLSGGENQSLKLSLGLSIRNKIIILDEPSQYLDSSRRTKLASILGQLMKDHFIIVIEHESSWLKNLPRKNYELKVENSILKAYDA